MDTLSASEALKKIVEMKSNMRKGILLQGNWGIGKTFLVEHLFDEKTIKAKNISVFGKTSVKEIEKGIIYKLLPGSDKITENGNDEKTDEIKKILKICGNVATGFIKHFGKGATEIINIFSDAIAIEDIPKINEERVVICIDDIERKADDVNIKDLFGLIERIKTKYDVILVCNIDKLNDIDKAVLSEYREKIIDYTIKLDHISQVTFNSIAKSSGIKCYEIAVDTYINDNVAFGKRSDRETFLAENINNIRNFNRYIELIKRIEEILGDCKIDEDICKVCKSVVYNYYYEQKSKGSNTFDRYNTHRAVERLFLNENITQEEFKEYICDKSKIKEDINALYNLYRLSEEEYNILIDSIMKRIKDKDLTYFIKQDNVISLVNVLHQIQMLNRCPGQAFL